MAETNNNCAALGRGEKRNRAIVEFLHVRDHKEKGGRETKNGVMVFVWNLNHRGGVCCLYVYMLSDGWSGDVSANCSCMCLLQQLHNLMCLHCTTDGLKKTENTCLHLISL